MHRERIVATLISTLFASALTRVISLITPFQYRPLSNPGLNFILLHGMERPIPDPASSFPSDHAALFFTIATGLFFVSKRVGIIALTYTFLFIAFPRVYTGLHNPSDIIAGALIGIIAAVAGNKYLTQNKNVASITSLSYSKPQYFYPLFFLLIYQIVDLFTNSRDFVFVMFKLFHKIVA
jgi:undecaprenyl-diphosphatase